MASNKNRRKNKGKKRNRQRSRSGEVRWDAHEEDFSRLEAGLKETGLDFHLEPRHSGTKLSAVLIEFGAPLLDEASNLARRKTALHLVIFAWNLSFFSPEEAREFLDTIWKPKRGVFGWLWRRGAVKRQLARLTVAGMMERKRELYARDRRFVATYDIQDLDDDFYFQVASLEIPEEVSAAELPPEAHAWASHFMR